MITILSVVIGLLLCSAALTALFFYEKYRILKIQNNTMFSDLIELIEVQNTFIDNCDQTFDNDDNGAFTYSIEDFMAFTIAFEIYRDEFSSLQHKANFHSKLFSEL